MTPEPWTLALPSEAYVRALAMATSGRPGQAWSAVAVLMLEALALFGLSGVFWRHLTGGTASSSGRRGPGRAVRVPELPLVAPPVAALAWAELKTALRTLPGRMALVSPLVMGLVFVFLIGSDWSFSPGGRARRRAGRPVGSAGPAGAIDLAGAVLAAGGLRHGPAGDPAAVGQPARRRRRRPGGGVPGADPGRRAGPRQGARPRSPGRPDHGAGEPPGGRAPPGRLAAVAGRAAGRRVGRLPGGAGVRGALGGLSEGGRPEPHGSGLPAPPARRLLRAC